METVTCSIIVVANFEPGKLKLILFGIFYCRFCNIILSEYYPITSTIILSTGAEILCNCIYSYDVSKLILSK